MRFPQFTPKQSSDSLSTRRLVHARPCCRNEEALFFCFGIFCVFLELEDSKANLQRTPNPGAGCTKFFRVGFWQNGFFADFYFWAAGSFCGFCRQIFSPHFGGKKVPRKILQENPQQNPPEFILQKSPTHFCIRAGPNSFWNASQRVLRSYVTEVCLASLLSLVLFISFSLSLSL